MKTHEQFIADLSKLSTTITVLDTYKGSKQYVTCLCTVDGNVWKAKPCNLLSGKGCPKCSGVYRRTHEEFVKDVRTKNPHISILDGVYRNQKQVFGVKCDLCGFIFTSRGSSLLQKMKGCSNCSSNRKKTHEEFVSKVREVSPTVIITGLYVRSVDKVSCKCSVCGHEWSANAGGLMQGSGCRKCAGTHPKTHEEFVEEMLIKHPNIEVIGNYTGGKFKVACRCKVDNHVWEPTPNNLLKPQKQGCPKCAKTGFDVTKPADLYVYSIGEDFGYGISNVPDARHRDHRRTFKNACVSYEHLLSLSGEGQYVLDFEKLLKSSFVNANIDLEGFKTESVRSEDKDLLFATIKSLCETSFSGKIECTFTKK